MSSYDCSFSYEEALFDLPSPVRKVSTYKKFTSCVVTKRSSTPIRQLSTDFKDKCSIEESMSCSTESSSSELPMQYKENKKPAAEKRKRTLRKKEHEARLNKIAYYLKLIFISFRAALIAAS